MAQGGDDCTIPTALTAFGTFSFDSSTATTSGFNGGGSCNPGASTINQDLFWAFTAPSSGAFQFDTNGSSFDTKLSVHIGGDCASTCAGYSDDDGVGLQSLVQLGGVSAGTVILVQVGGFGANSGQGLLNITEYVDPCLPGNDDAFEENDLCTSPASIVAGFYPGLFVAADDRDFYRITLQASEVITVTASNTTTAIDVAIYDAGCTVLVGNGTGVATYSTVGAAGPVDLIVEASLDLFSTASCGSYDLEIAVTPDPCALLPDAFEENDDCASAVALGDGFYPGLSAFENDNDYFAIALAAGATLDCEILFVDAAADLDLYLWDPAVECDTNVAGTGGAYLARGFTASDDEQILYTNATGSTQNLIIEIDVFSIGGCNNYDLQLSGVSRPGGGVGVAYCPSNANSTGVPSMISATGSVAVADNDLTLSATDLPTSSFGLFLVSRTQGFDANPAGSAGNLCLGGEVGRFDGSGRVMDSGALGVIDLTIDLTAIPQRVGFEATVAGDQWNFQLWHRDSSPSGPTSNFTNGLQIDFI